MTLRARSHIRKTIYGSVRTIPGTGLPSTESARHFADLIDGVEHRGEHYTIIRRGRVLAHLAPVRFGRGRDVKSMLRRYEIDDDGPGSMCRTRRE